MWYHQLLQCTERLYLVHFALTHPNLSTRLVYVNVSFLASSCEAQVFYYEMRMTAAANEAKPAHPVQEDFDFWILLRIILFIRYTEDTFLKDIVFVFAILRCSVLFWFQKVSVISLLTNHLFLVFVASSWTYVTSCLPWCL